MYLTSKLLLLGVMMYAGADDICLNKTEYDFYILGNLVKDFENRIHMLRQNVKEMVLSKCPKPQRACSDDWVSYNGSCYFFENTATYNFEEARVLCKQKGSLLLYVENEAEDAFISRTINRFKSDTKFWFNALSDKDSEGHWKWIDASISTKYVNWAPGQPDSGNRQNCVVYNKDNNQWHDTECDAKWFVVCKREI